MRDGHGLGRDTYLGFFSSLMEVHVCESSEEQLLESCDPSSSLHSFSVPVLNWLRWLLFDNAFSSLEKETRGGGGLYEGVQVEQGIVC